MFPSQIKKCIITLVFLVVITEAQGQDRKLTSVLNPGCKYCTPYETLMYVRADGAHGTVHQLWDFTRGTPTIIFIITNLTATVNMTWDIGTPRRIWVSEKPKYSFAIAMDKLYEYNDIEDKGHIDDRCQKRAYSFDNATWTLDDVQQSPQEVELRMLSQYKDSDKSGSIVFKLDVLPFEDYAAELPHLIHTANSTLVDVSLVNLTTSSYYNSSRFALHFILVSTDSNADSMNYTMRKSLDDEHTPGMFEIIEILTPAWRRAAGGFLQLRPVAYTRPQRSVTTSTILHISNFNRTHLHKGSMLRTFYRPYSERELLVQDMFVSFGETGDGGYRQHNFTAWSFTIGYGMPPKEGFSVFVIVIISVGLGIPVALALSGAIYVLVRRLRARRGTRLLDDQ